MAETRGLKSLENWSKRVTSGYNGVNVTNMSSSFRDGLAFCAIIHHYYPDLIDFSSLSKDDIYHNNSLAFSTAEKKLGVPALLDAEDMVNCSVPDRLSIITYLSQLHNCFENQNRVTKIRKKLILQQDQGFVGVPAKIPNISIPKSHEVCHVCKHRVFILERQMVAGKLYHRTCFKCSKCSNLLMPGAYVESDDYPGAYECVICPKDERKSTDIDAIPIVKEEEMSNGIDSANDSTPSVSPLTSPKLPVLSSKLNAARNDFLKNNIEDKTFSASEHEHSVSEKSSSEESLSHRTPNESAQNLDSGFKDENIADVITENAQHPVKPIRQSKYLSSLPPSPLRPLDSKTDKEHKPYQSVLTREIYSSLTPLSRTAKLSLCPTENNRFKDVPSSKPTTDIPFIRSSSYSATSLPRTKISSSESGSNIDSNLAATGQKSFSNSNLTDKPNYSIERIRRKGSFDSPISESGDSKPHAVISETGKSDFAADTELLSPTSVKELIQLREASIRKSSIVTDGYKRQSKPFRNSIVSNNVDEVDDISSKTRETPSRDVPDISNCDFVKETEQITTESTAEERKSNEVVAEVQGKSEEAAELQKSHEVSELQEKSDKIAEKEITDDVYLKSSESEQHNNDISVIQPEKEISIIVSKEDEQDPLYPDDLNPFGDDDDDDVEEEENKARKQNVVKKTSYPITLNPFGDSDEDEETGKKVIQRKHSDYDESKNPFASDDDDDDSGHKAKSNIPAVKSPSMNPYVTPQRPPVPTPPRAATPKSSTSHSSPSTPGSSVRSMLKKRQAPKAPHVKDLFHSPPIDSVSSNNSSPSSLKPSPSPKIRKNKPAPPPPPSPALSNRSDESGKAKEEDNAQLKSNERTRNSFGSVPARKKRPAPPVPIPRRREIKKIPISEIRAEMKEIAEKQVELEEHGRKLEVLIRDRDKDEEPTVEEEEYIMQLFELVNEKNALFRRQAELMYIKRSQRLEEEQIELEFQIRCLMNKPATQKSDEDKGIEEKLVQQLLDVVDQRNEIVDTIEMDRRREAEEDNCVQEQMEIKNSDLPITAEIKEKSAKEKKSKKHKEKKAKKKKKSKEVSEDANQPSEASKKSTLRLKWL